MTKSTPRRVRVGRHKQSVATLSETIWDASDGTHMLVTVEEWERCRESGAIRRAIEIERLRAENERLKAFIADKIHDATRERMLMEVQGE